MTPLEQILQRFREEYDSGNGAGVMAPISVIESLITEAYETGQSVASYGEGVQVANAQDVSYKQGFAAAIGKVREDIESRKKVAASFHGSPTHGAIHIAMQYILEHLTRIEESKIH